MDGSKGMAAVGIDKAKLAVGGLVVAMCLFAVGGAIAFGVGPFGNETGGPAGPTQSAGSGEPPAENHVRPFTIDVRNIQQCGDTCRDVTVSITNNGGNSRTNVSVATTIYAGNDDVWHGEEAVGTLDADESTTQTKRIKVGFVGGAKIKRNDGIVTIETVVRWDGGSATYSERRDVA